MAMMRSLSRIIAVVAALVLLTTARPLLADSDGDFCVTPSYLAYGVRLGSPAHELRVVSLAPPLSQGSLRAITLPDFQVHGMHCTETAILVLGWDTVYTVSLSPEARPLSMSSKKLAHGGSRPPPFAKTDRARNLGSLARSRVVPLGGLPSKVFLVTKLEPSEKPCELRVISRLEEVDPQGRILSALRLYDGWRGTDCGR